jgi:hypothetical protein
MEEGLGWDMMGWTGKGFHLAKMDVWALGLLT